jgi:murein DD-endopeptidase MepM/ murein hydrolase activator NlpD
MSLKPLSPPWFRLCCVTAMGAVLTLAFGSSSLAQPGAVIQPENPPAPPPAKTAPATFSYNVFPKDDSGAVVLHQGQAFLVWVEDPGKALASVRARWDDQAIPCLPDSDRLRWIGVGGVGKDKKPGSYELVITLETTTGKKTRFKQTITVNPAVFPEAQLSVAPAMVQVPPELKAKVDEDHKAFASVWAHPAYSRYWDGPFIRPVPGRVTAPYGEKRVYNNVVNSQHGGVDLAGPEGEPVLAAAAGKVVLVRESYLEGNTVVLDHGGGLFTYYCHLSAFKVETGQMVKAGDVIALVGQTGRVTGPHLHFGVRVQGVKVDGMSLLELSPWLK